jgi:hypothetical protein
LVQRAGGLNDVCVEMGLLGWRLHGQHRHQQGGESHHCLSDGFERSEAHGSPR